MRKIRNHPPRLAKRLLTRLIDYQNRFAMNGDLEEVFHKIAQKKGYRKAKRWYWLQSLRAVPQYIRYLMHWNAAMFKNYFKTALRNLKRQKSHSVVNILGLSIGIASCVLIFLFIWDELSYDRFHKNAESIYAVVCRNEFHNMTTISGPAAMAPIMKDYFPEVQETVRFKSLHRVSVRYEERLFNEVAVFTDAHMFNVFSFPLVSGDPQTVLQYPNSVVLSESTAEKYFGTEQPLGKYMTMVFGDLKKEFMVSGICRDIPGNSTIRFDILLNIKNLEEIRGPEYFSNWQWFDTRIFVKLFDESSPDIVNSRFPAFVNQYFQDTMKRWKDSGSWTGEGPVFSFSLGNIKSLHLNSQILGVGASSTTKSAVLGGIALLILAIACINFINLSIGRASGRVLEVGMRRVLGAGRKDLMRQFWTESLLLVFLTVLAALFLAALFLPVFKQLSEKQLNVGSIFSLPGLLMSFVFLMIVATAAGGFPGLFMSRLQPVEIIRGRMQYGGKAVLTKFLLAAQFFLAVFLIFITMTMARQIKTMAGKELGFRKDGVLVVSLQENNWEQGPKTEALIEKFRVRLQKHKNILNISGSTMTFDRFAVLNHIKVKGKTYDVYFNPVFYDFLDTMGIRLVKGRTFSRERSSDREAVLVNEKFVKQYGLEQPLSESIWDAYDPSTPLRIIGIIEDYHFFSVKQEIEPMILHMRPSYSKDNALIKVTLDDIPKRLALVEQAWKEIQPDKPFQFYFLDDAVDSAYREQKRWFSIVRYASILAVLITCMGVFALTSLSLHRRVKEIGIRKVLGAGIRQIVSMVCRDFVVLIMVASLLAWPLAFWVMRRWLQGFATRTGLGPELFLFSGLITLGVALMTTGVLAARAALRNPVDSIRQE